MSLPFSMEESLIQECESASLLFSLEESLIQESSYLPWAKLLVFRSLFQIDACAAQVESAPCAFSPSCGWLYRFFRNRIGTIRF